MGVRLAEANVTILVVCPCSKCEAFDNGCSAAVPGGHAQHNAPGADIPLLQTCVQTRSSRSNTQAALPTLDGCDASGLHCVIPPYNHSDSSKATSVCAVAFGGAVSSPYE